MRLIDADLLMRKCEKWLKPKAPDEDEMVSLADIAVSMLMEIEEQPTAFDTQKIVKELEDLKMRYFLTLANTGDADKDCAYLNIASAIDRAIEIVKGGIADAEDAKDANVPGKWIPISVRLPEDESYILVSFENATMPDIARYEENDEGGTFYPGDDEKSYSSYGLFVNAWMSLPEPYREVE